jgi:DNA mismatch endonuclease, patch repair protein
MGVDLPVGARRGPAPSSQAARKRMEVTKQRDTAPEIALRSALFRLGLRYRVNVQPIRELHRRADIVFPRAKVAIYVQGCFWHGCPVHATWPKANAQFWREKIEANQRRDADTCQRLIEAGWLPIQVWEHEDPIEVARRTAEIVRSREFS